eukprot:CAMPEP_0194309340 /NCGR_PEP_ID=MMETSP0171-20130528/6314_1 /TAXON_ID=218684 /ORGANISM="Corethron pennatum, Strain L29A3" /LENGTH=249 /DNA_ID=CAMNT_0039062467 /DNA_START=10 /DNA_END=759 /DNA_ORIENTATION=-
MTRVRLDKGRDGVSYKWFAFGSIAAALLICALFFTDATLPSKSTIRSSVLDNGKASAAAVTSAAKSGASVPQSATEGRRITFELASLKGGGTGTLTIQTRPSWAPLGVAQFHALVDAGFFEGCRFFRVVPNFVVQFGISGNPAVQAEWRKIRLQDDPVVATNKRGTVTFATSGPNTRTTQMFINTAANKGLDGQGFSPIGEIISGMDVVDQINDEYREKPKQGKIQMKGNEYLEEFPKMSYISSTKDKV